MGLSTFSVGGCRNLGLLAKGSRIESPVLVDRNAELDVVPLLLEIFTASGYVFVIVVIVVVILLWVCYLC